jgi:RHS repeat-associated protein
VAYHTFDPQGNACHRLNTAGTVLSTDSYDAYRGTVQHTPGGTADVFGFGAQWGYQTDPETGLVLLTNRYYDPGLARFLTRDPIGPAGGANLYGYAGNGPVNGADPLGLFTPVDAAVGLLGGIGGAAGFAVSKNPAGAAIGFGLGAGLARYVLGGNAGDAADEALNDCANVLTLGEFAGAVGPALPSTTAAL